MCSSSIFTSTVNDCISILYGFVRILSAANKEKECSGTTTVILY